VPKKILVTGSTGFIGSRLVRRLLRADNEVYALVRKRSTIEALEDIKDRIHFVEGDITVASSLESAFQGMDQVYHAAGYTYMGGRNGKDRLLDAINVDGTRNVMNAALLNNVSRVIHVSSITAVGMSKKNGKPFDESSLWNFGEIGLHYAETKRLSEVEVKKAVGKGLDCVIVNPAFVFGAGDVNFNAGRLIKDVYHKTVPFYPLGGICVVDVEIVADAVVRAMEVGRTGERYILGGDNVTYKELSDIISRVTGTRRFMFPLPYPIAILVHRFFSVSPFKTRISKLFNPMMFRVASEFLYFSSRKAIRELDMRTEPIEFSIRRAFEWYKKEGLL